MVLSQRYCGHALTYSNYSCHLCTKLGGVRAHNYVELEAALSLS